MKLLVKNRDDRFASANELARSLGAIDITTTTLPSQPMLPRTEIIVERDSHLPGPATAGSMFSKKWPILLGLGVLVAAIIAGIVLF
jgi:hypothetical protein